LLSSVEQRGVERKKYKNARSRIAISLFGVHLERGRNLIGITTNRRKSREGAWRQVTEGGALVLRGGKLGFRSARVLRVEGCMGGCSSSILGKNKTQRGRRRTKRESRLRNTISLCCQEG